MAPIHYNEPIQPTTFGNNVLQECGYTKAICKGGQTYNNGPIQVYSTVYIMKSSEAKNVTAMWYAQKLGDATSTDVIKYGELFGMAGYALDRWLNTCGMGGCSVSTEKFFGLRTTKPNVGGTDSQWKFMPMKGSSKKVGDVVQDTDEVMIVCNIQNAQINDRRYLAACGPSPDGTCLGIVALLSSMTYAQTPYRGFHLGGWRIKKIANNISQIKCMLGISHGCISFYNDSILPDLKKKVINDRLGIACQESPETMKLCALKDGWYRKEQGVAMDEIILEKCKGEWKDNSLCACFNKVPAASEFPGYNPICHNAKCQDPNGQAYRTPSMNDVKCPPLVICQQNLNVTSKSAVIKDIKFTNNCQGGDSQSHENINTPQTQSVQQPTTTQTTSVQQPTTTQTSTSPKPLPNTSTAKKPLSTLIPRPSPPTTSLAATPATSQTNNNNNNNNILLIGGISAGIFLLLLIIIVIVVLVKRTKQ